MTKRKRAKRKNLRKKRLNKKSYSFNKTVIIKKNSLTNLTLKTPLKVFQKDNIINDLIENFKSNYI